MPLIPQQDIVVITGPYDLAKDEACPEAATRKLQGILASYPDCRIVSISGSGIMHGYTLTAVIETV